MLLFPNFSRDVKDLDGCDISDNLESAIEEVTYEMDLPLGWFNNTSNKYYFPKPEHTVQVASYSNLDIFTPSKEYLLCLKIMSGRPEEKANDTADVEFMIDNMPAIQEEADWQKLYKQFFNKTDWPSFTAAAAKRALEKKHGKTSAEMHTKNPAAPMILPTINENEWKHNPNITLPKKSHATSDPTGRFWGEEGAGCVFWCPKTKRVLLAKRSADVNEPHTWGTWGGAVDKGESPRDSVRREAEEECGVAPQSIIRVWTWQDPQSAFRYHNYVCVVDKEFAPKLNWETTTYVWTTLDNPPNPLHFGLKAFWPHLVRWSKTQLVRPFRINPSRLKQLTSEIEKEQEMWHEEKLSSLLRKRTK